MGVYEFATSPKSSAVKVSIRLSSSEANTRSIVLRMWGRFRATTGTPALQLLAEFHLCLIEYLPKRDFGNLGGYRGGWICQSEKRCISAKLIRGLPGQFQANFRMRADGVGVVFALLVSQHCRKGQASGRSNSKLQARAFPIGVLKPLACRFDLADEHLCQIDGHVLLGLLWHVYSSC